MRVPTMASPSRGHRRHEEHEEHEEHVNHEAWVIPYADMLTLLMCLFLVLFAIGRTDAEKSKLAAQSFRNAVGNGNVVALGGSGDNPLAAGLDGGQGILTDPSPVAVNPTPAAQNPVTPQVISTHETVVPALAETPVSPDDIAKATQQQALDKAQVAVVPLAELQRALQADADGKGLGSDLLFRLEAKGLVVTIVTDKILFTAGSAALQGDGLSLLDFMANELTHITNDVSIEGHTDSRPISTSQYPSNWELSTDRATSVLRYMIGRHGLTGERLSAAGYADTHPIADNATVEGAARNRRVEIVVLSEVSLSPIVSPVITIEPDVIPQPGGTAATQAGQ
jgi:chemotaxis protein MotB